MAHGAKLDLMKLKPLFELLAAFLLMACLTANALGDNHVPPVTQNGAWDKLMQAAVKAQKDGNLKESEKLCVQAINLAKDYPPNDMSLARSHVFMGGLNISLGRPQEAEKSYKHAVSLMERGFGPRHPALVKPLESLANYYFYTEVDYNKAAEIARRIMELVEYNLHDVQREMAARAHNLAEAYMLAERNEEAEPMYAQAIEWAKRSNSDIYGHLIEQAHFYLKWGKCDKAEEVALRALEIQEGKADPGAGLTSQADNLMCLSSGLDVLGEIYLDCGKPEKAEAVFTRSLKNLEKAQGSKSVDLVPRLTGLAMSKRLLGKYKEAETHCRRAQMLVEELLAPDAPEIIAVLDEYAAVLSAGNRDDEARELTERAESMREKHAKHLEAMKGS